MSVGVCALVVGLWVVSAGAWEVVVVVSVPCVGSELDVCVAPVPAVVVVALVGVDAAESVLTLGVFTVGAASPPAGGSVEVP